MKLTRTLASIDTESTGTHPESDRVIELGVVLLAPDGARSTRRWLINPGRPIPPEATAVHHITDAMVADVPRFEDVADEIDAVLRGVDLVGYNLRAFDLPILRREFERAVRPWPCDGARVYDAYVVFKEREPHSLTTAVRRYCGRQLVAAHSAVADAEATLDVALAQIAEYPDLAVLDLTALEVLSGGQRPDWATELGHLRWNDDGDLCVGFGKHAGRRLADMEWGFLRWVMGKDFPADVKSLVAAVQRGGRPRAPGAPEVPPEHDDNDCDDFLRVPVQEPAPFFGEAPRARRLDLGALTSDDDIPF